MSQENPNRFMSLEIPYSSYFFRKKLFLLLLNKKYKNDVEVGVVLGDGIFLDQQEGKQEYTK